MYLRHGLRRPNAAGVWGVGHGTQNTLLACAHRILTTATPFCSLFLPPAALANVPLSTREPFATQHRQPSRRQSRQAASRIADASIEAGSRPGTFVLPSQRPSRRRSRFPARRLAGTSNRSRQPTGDLRPPSPGERPRKGAPLPGFRRKPERIRIIFPGDMCGGKNTPRGAKCRGRLGGPGAQAECHRHRRNAGAGSWKWLRHFHETPHGAKCGCKAAVGRPCSRTRAQCFAIVSAPFGR